MVVKIVFQNIMFGNPVQIIIDDTQFNSNEMKKFCFDNELKSTMQVPTTQKPMDM